ncbi:replication-associated protein [Avon-Heathcote Estuary associated circular virus 1]|uniref:replication-associated protein n=1 Tax=Avon-Heathcote Estuary associated circular virus 1 TaxID=1618232 RepID=UPI0005CD6F58|nr:replication-associated protein [Avon-Heathcote Estuary associated circular virus 1]AJP36331.1 replication-associated protein [Avon-Heathcote Estuary associated circular virus 1]AJP36333.1 replication-associated protein [Avon-Heathcote Estuary associated circular virus 1]
MKTRLWCGTQYDLGFNFEKLVDDEILTYVAWGDEVCPTTERKHKQFWCMFKSPRGSMKQVGKVFTSWPNKGMQGKVFPCSGSIKSNEEYCKKEGSYHKYGKEPEQGKRNDIIGCMKMVKEGAAELEIAETSPHLWCQYGRRFEEYRALLQPDRDWVPEVKVWWGEPGSGKSRAAREWLGEYDVCTYTAGGFFIGYKNHESVLLEDFDFKSMPRDVFLQCTDRYKHVVNVKNGERNWNPRRIAITSNFDPEEWYKWGDPKAVTRRITSITKMEHK